MIKHWMSSCGKQEDLNSFSEVLYHPWVLFKKLTEHLIRFQKPNTRISENSAEPFVRHSWSKNSRKWSWELKFIRCSPMVLYSIMILTLVLSPCLVSREFNNELSQSCVYKGKTLLVFFPAVSSILYIVIGEPGEVVVCDHLLHPLFPINKSCWNKAVWKWKSSESS